MSRRPVPNSSIPLWKAFGAPEVEIKNSFNDVHPASIYITAVEWALSRGITNGLDSHHFGPDQTLSPAAGVHLPVPGHEWDGKTLTLITVDEDDGELEETTGELQADGSIGIMGLGYFFPVEERSYGPDMAGSSFMEAGGMEGELEGDWIHSSGHRMLTFDGRGSVTFQETYEGAALPAPPAGTAMTARP